MAIAGTLEYLISIDSSKLNSGMASAESKVKGFGNKISARTVAMGHMIANFATKAIGTTTRFVKDAVQSSMSFDKSMAQVAATLGKTTDQVKDLSKFARKMGAETAFTAEEAAQGLNYMALAGYDAEKSMKMLPQVLNLAAAGNFDLAHASDMVTDAQSALGLSIEQTETLIDEMAKASSKTNTSVSQLGDAILTVGGTAKMIKGGTQELTAVLGVLADNGIKGSEGGTALRNVLLALSAPTDKAAKQIKQLGVDVFDAQGNMRSMPDIMSDLNVAMKDMTQEQRTNIISEIFNKRDLKAVEALLGTQTSRWQELYKEIGNAKGAADQMAKTQLDNLAGDVTKFKSALGETKLAIVEGLTPAFRKWTQFGTVAVQRITKAFQKKGLKGAIEEVKFIFGETMDVLRKSSSKVLSTIGKIGYLFKDGFKGLKVNAATLLGIDDPQNTTWANIGEKIKEKLKLGIKKAKIVVADFLDIPDPAHASWGDIANKIVSRIKQKIHGGGEFIKSLVLGDSYKQDESTWEDVATAMTEHAKKAFEKGGLLDVILGNAAEFAAAAVQFGGNLIAGIADWIAQPDNVTRITDIITSIARSIGEAAPEIINALAKVLGSPELWGGIGSAIETVIKNLLVQAGLIKEEKKEAVGTEKSPYKIMELFAPWAASIFNTKESEERNAPSNGATVPTYSDFQNLTPEQKAMAKETYGLLWKSFFGGIGDQVSEETYQDVKKRFNKAFEGYEDVGSALNDALDQYFRWYENNQKEAPKEIDDEFFKKPSEVVYEANFDTVESAEPPVKQGTVNYSADFGDGESEGDASGSAGDFHRLFGNAKGNWYVPYDNYPSLLHRGEMVLNKSQARQFRDSVGGDYDMGSMVSDAVSSAMSKVYVMLSGEKVGDLTTKRVRKNINATTYNKLRAMGG